MAARPPRPPTASGRRSTSRRPSACRSCSSSRTTATASRCRPRGRRRAATSRRTSRSFRNLQILSGDGSDPLAAAALIEKAVRAVRGGEGPVLLKLRVPRLSGHSAQDTQAYKSPEEIEGERARDPLLQLRKRLVPAEISEAEWQSPRSGGRIDRPGGARADRIEAADHRNDRGAPCVHRAARRRQPGPAGTGRAMGGRRASRPAAAPSRGRRARASTC